MTPFVKVCRPCGKDGLGEKWERCEVSPTINLFDLGDTRTVVAIVGKGKTANPTKDSWCLDPYNVQGRNEISATISAKSLESWSRNGGGRIVRIRRKSQ